MGKIKIAYLASAYSIHTVRWVNEMARRGYEIHLISMHHPNVHNSVDKAVKMHLLPFPPPLGYFLNKWHLKRLLKRIKPDLLHTHYASGYGMLSRLSDFHPTLLSVWGSDVFDFPYQSRWKDKILRQNLADADYIASTSYIMKQQTEKFISPKHPIVVTPFGIDCEKFRPIRWLNNQNEFTIGTVKTLEEVYSVDYLIKAFSIAKHTYSGLKRLKLLIVGDGSLKNQLIKLVAELGIDRDVMFLGSVPHADVPKILNCLSVYVAISLRESFGVAVLEASACGIPVIVSDVGGLNEVVKDCVTGFIVPARNPQATADAILKLIEDGEIREQMGKNGRNFVLKNYEWNENATRMEKLYERIIKEWK